MHRKQSHNSSRCRWIRLHLPALAAGEAAPSVAEACQAHLADCPECRGELERIRVALASLRHAPQPHPPDAAVEQLLASLRSLPAPVSLRRRLRLSLVSAGAVATVLVGLLIVMVVWQAPGPLSRGPSLPPALAPSRHLPPVSPEASVGGQGEEVLSGVPAPAPSAPRPEASGKSPKEAAPEQPSAAGGRETRTPSTLRTRPGGRIGGQPSVRPSIRPGGAAGPGPAREAPPEAPPTVPSLRRPAPAPTDMASKPPDIRLHEPSKPDRPEPTDARASRPREEAAPARAAGAPRPRPTAAGRSGASAGVGAAPSSPAMMEGAAPSAKPRAEREYTAPAGPAAAAKAAVPMSLPRSLAGPGQPAGGGGEAGWTVSDQFWQLRVEPPRQVVEKQPASVGLIIRGRAALSTVDAWVADEQDRPLGQAVRIPLIEADQQLDVSLSVLASTPGMLRASVVVRSQDPVWTTRIPLTLRVRPASQQPAPDTIAIVLREVPLRKAVAMIAKAAALEVSVSDELADLVVDADFSEPIPAEAALRLLAEQVGGTLVAGDGGYEIVAGHEGEDNEAH